MPDRSFPTGRHALVTQKATPRRSPIGIQRKNRADLQRGVVAKVDLNPEALGDVTSVVTAYVPAGSRPLRSNRLLCFRAALRARVVLTPEATSS